MIDFSKLFTGHGSRRNWISRFEKEEKIASPTMKDTTGARGVIHFPALRRRVKKTTWVKLLIMFAAALWAFYYLKNLG
jgi:hypothetical protein